MNYLAENLPLITGGITVINLVLIAVILTRFMGQDKKLETKLLAQVRDYLSKYYFSKEDVQALLKKGNPEENNSSEALEQEIASMKVLLENFERRAEKSWQKIASMEFLTNGQEQRGKALFEALLPHLQALIKRLEEDLDSEQKNLDPQEQTLWGEVCRDKEAYKLSSYNGREEKVRAKLALNNSQISWRNFLRDHHPSKLDRMDRLEVQIERHKAIIEGLKTAFNWHNNQKVLSPSSPPPSVMEDREAPSPPPTVRESKKIPPPPFPTEDEDEDWGERETVVLDDGIPSSEASSGFEGSEDFFPFSSG